MITVDLLMSTHPCADWPRERVERLVPRMDCRSWSAFAASAKASRWRRVSVDDLTLTACRYAAAHHRADVLVPWVQHVTRLRVDAQRKRYPHAPAGVVAAWDALDTWDGTAATARGIRDRACDVWRSAAAARAAAAAARAADAAAADAAAADAAYVAYVAADADARSSMLFDLCARLDAAMRAA